MDYYLCKKRRYKTTVVYKIIVNEQRVFILFPKVISLKDSTTYNPTKKERKKEGQSIKKESNA